MSVTLHPGELSNPDLKPWLITVVVVVVIVWSAAADVVRAYADVLTLMTVLFPGAGQRWISGDGSRRHAER
ncbi:hypothetical protein ABB07_11105 [Streptomyces incarnatus]|uniref:Uncharacterized protein n=1 Tax=Streptomyces incarnatus TaxID=665007 RepID=A0ABM5THS2_9ACTN|nr:hypothetical protein [Streptomyces incarnatus]AKJ10544.1 hypothetical protein ABB07_11105 [Streptomyces incarnatus]